MLDRIDLNDLEHRDAVLSAGFKAWERIAWFWQLTDDERSSLVQSLDEGESLEGQAMRDRATKLGMMIGIYRRLKILYSDQLAYAWVKLPKTNPLFGGERPVDFMVEGGIPAMALREFCYCFRISNHLITPLSVPIIASAFTLSRQMNSRSKR